jgi:hypothetical protein
VSYTITKLNHYPHYFSYKYLRPRGYSILSVVATAPAVSYLTIIVGVEAVFTNFAPWANRICTLVPPEKYWYIF